MTVPVEALLAVSAEEAKRLLKRASEHPDLVEAYEEKLHDAPEISEQEEELDA